MTRYAARCLLPVTRFLREEEGQAVTETILIVALIVLPFALAFNKLAGVMKTVLFRINRLLYGPGI